MYEDDIMGDDDYLDWEIVSQMCDVSLDEESSLLENI